MRSCTAIVLALGGLLAATAASAAPVDPNVAVQVSAVVTQVTLSRAQTDATDRLDTLAGYLVAVQNGASNDLNRIRFTASTAVLGADTSAAIEAKVVQVSGGNPQCALTSATAIDCNIGQLPPGGGISFVVVVKVPTAGSRIDLHWDSTYAEGKSKSPGASHGDGGNGGVTSTQLVTQDDPTVRTELKSFVKASGGSFFTGGTGVATPADPWTTSVAVPPFSSDPYSTAAVLEAVADDPQIACTADLIECWQTSLTIPGSFAALQIRLRKDASIIKSGAKIDNAVVWYFGHHPGVVYPIQLADCTAALPAQPGVPCIAERRAYLTSDKPKPSADFLGDWEFLIRALDNGRYLN